MRFASFLGCLFACSLMAQTSPFNGRPLVPADSLGRYRLLIGGHFHGASSNTSGYPAATVLANLDRINATGANAFLSTGDLFLAPDRDSARYARAFFSKLLLPLFNAPGNHDVEGRSSRNASAFPVLLELGGDLVVLFDTEKDDSRITGPQLALLQDLADGSMALGAKRLFIVSHRPIWAEKNKRYSALFAGNTRSLLGGNYESTVLPLLQRIAVGREIFWISGSMAGRAPSSIFFQPGPSNITYIQCAVRDELRDALLLADVGPDGIAWTGLSLTGTAIPDVRSMDADWWERQRPPEAGFKWRLIPYLIRKNLSYPAFWYGVILGSLIMALVARRLRRSHN